MSVQQWLFDSPTSPPRYIVQAIMFLHIHYGIMGKMASSYRLLKSESWATDVHLKLQSLGASTVSTSG